MQSEAGQQLESIVRRKELERTAGKGEFFWGIGTPLGSALTQMVATTDKPEVLFSVMRTAPRREDYAPEGVLLWTGYIDVSGRYRPLPAHALVTSRATTLGGDKRRHYALVCHSDRPLRLEKLGSLNASHLWNAGSAITRVGSSQVTAVVEHATLYSDDIPGRGPFYEVNMRARLSSPFLARLTNPLPLPGNLYAELQRASSSIDNPSDWQNMVSSVFERVKLHGGPWRNPSLFD